MQKLVITLVCTLGFVVLFYQQEPGINVSLFMLMVWFGTQFLPRVRRNLFFWILSLCCFSSALSFAWYGDELSFLALAFSVWITVYYTQFPRLNLFLYPFVLCLNVVTYPLRFLRFNLWIPGFSGRIQWQKWLACAVIPLLLFVLFFAVYATGSNLLAQLVKQAAFAQTLWVWLFMAAIAWFLLFQFWYIWLPKAFIRFNAQMRTSGPHQKWGWLPSWQFTTQKWEEQGTFLTLVLLNGLLCCFITIYNYEQFFAVAAKNVLSDQTHERVLTVIVSILLAIAILMYSFRRHDAPAQQSSRTRTAAFIWIALNALLVLSAFAKNAEYVFTLGLTVKRICVIVFLILSLLGLLFTWIKIRRRQDNVVFVNKMGWTFFFTLVMLAPINFSNLITRFNLQQAHPDTEYLKTLRFNDRILFETFHNAPGWQSYFRQKEPRLRAEKQKNLLSSALYFTFLNWKPGTTTLPVKGKGN